jgi:hypothetical protein
MNSQSERAAAAALYWSKPARRDPDAVRGAVAGMGDAELAEVRAILAGGTLNALSDEALIERMVGLAVKVVDGLEHKSLTATDVTVETDASLGVFSGYLAAFARDAVGDTITPDGLDGTVRDFQAGLRRWLLTDGHSDQAGDVVAEVDTAQLDEVGLFITAKWMGSDRAQQLRQLVLDGAKLGLSIDWDGAYRPDGQGGRLLTRVDVYGGAITPKPMNGRAIITEGKTARGGTVALAVPIVDVYAQAQAQHRDPDRARLRLMAEVVAASWVSPGLAKSIGTEMAYRMVMGAAEAKAHRELEGDPERTRARQRWERANEYSSNLAAWMAEHR